MWRSRERRVEGRWLSGCGLPFDYRKPERLLRQPLRQRLGPVEGEDLAAPGLGSSRFTNVVSMPVVR